MYRTLLSACVLCVCFVTNASAEGFTMTEWSARGLGLAGGMVGRADDVSALAYNAAGLTQVPGTSFMMGATAIHPYGEHDAIVINSATGQRTHDSTTLKYGVWTPPHLYLSHQLNDDVWLGLAVFTRYGLGISYEGDWFGRYNVYDVGLSTVSVVPTVAYKINEVFSVSAGLELMHLHFYQGSKVPSVFTPAEGKLDNDMQVEGQGVGIGGHFGLHARLNEQWSVGLTYKTQVTQNVHGDVNFGRQGTNIAYKKTGGIKNQYDCDASATIQFPDSFALGIAYKPLENLSFEVGTIYTRWSSINHLNIYFDDPSGYHAKSEKNWKDGWNINASVEYKPTDWLALRAGYWYDSPVVNENHADFMVPSYGRDVLTLGAGLSWENWQIDLAYAHIWIHELNYNNSSALGVQGVVQPCDNAAGSDLYSMSLSYTF